jgi:hypothetical protein
MDTTVKPKHSANSLKDEHGNYPVWMAKRQIQKKKKGSGKKTTFGEIKSKHPAGKVSKKFSGKKKK